MASIRKIKRKKGTVYCFTVSLTGTDGKQVRRYTTWDPPAGLTPAKLKKAVALAAETWEAEVRETWKNEEIVAPSPPPNNQRIDFLSFVNDVWMPVEIRGSDRKPKTVAFYAAEVKILNVYFQGAVLQDLTPLDLQKYLVYLRTEYKGQYGVGLKPKTVHHHYNLLHLIFAYAEKQELIVRNPMNRVDSPKKENLCGIHQTYNRA